MTNDSLLLKYNITTKEQIAAFKANLTEVNQSTCDYWSTNNLNRFIIPLDLLGLHKAINGNVIGIAQQTALYCEYLSQIS